MLTSLDASAQQFLNSLNRISQRMDTAQRQISTGVRLGRVSDDPDQVSTLLQARADLSASDQIKANLGRIKAEVDGGEQALESAVQLFERARTLGAQGASGTQTAASQVALGQEVGSILEQLVGTAGTQVAGRYIFSGDSDQLVPYTVDLTQTPPVSAYLGSGSTRVAQHPNGTTFALGRTAQEIFDSPTPEDNVFLALTNLRDALLANDDAGIRTALDGMGQVGDHLNSELAYYGTTQNKIAEATDFADTRSLQLQTQIGDIQDADLTSAILELNQSQTQQQAALSARARLPRTSLFDYLG